jgi:catechol 2,3-dioxygenase-like lactoylglutathione lyase family enzyme
LLSSADASLSERARNRRSGRLHLAFSIGADDLDAWRQRLCERGVDIVSEYRWPRGGVSLYMCDPDEVLVELATPGLWW